MDFPGFQKPRAVPGLGQRMTPSSLPCPMPSSLQEVAGDPGGASPVGGPQSWIYIMYDMIYIYIYTGIVLRVYIYIYIYTILCICIIYVILCII